jgi:hypothetical protein
MSQNNSFPLVFKSLKEILLPYAKNLHVLVNTPQEYSLEGPFSEKWKKKIHFGGVKIGRNYVSFYLMPVYMFPDLLKDITPELKKHMQGKSCFNFRQADAELFEELSALTQSGAERFKQDH